eukprot:m.146827 g.146827  ORF g.146827 m.146827 type:complete len:524 (-) comp14153_c0_seq1:1471-3042(-)
MSVLPSTEASKRTHTTVFIGNLPADVGDIFIKDLFAKMGAITTWDRSAVGSSRTFALCTYSNPDETLRTLRLLDGIELASNKIKVTVDETTRKFLDEFQQRGRELRTPEQQTAFDQTIAKDDEARKRSLEVVLRRINAEHAVPELRAQAAVVEHQDAMFKLKDRVTSEVVVPDQDKEGKAKVVVAEIHAFRRATEQKKTYDATQGTPLARALELAQSCRDKRQERYLRRVREDCEAKLHQFEKSYRSWSHDLEKHRDEDQARKADDAYHASKQREFERRYNDEEDDERYYRSRELERLIDDRRRERLQDERDARAEQREIEAEQKKAEAAKAKTEASAKDTETKDTPTTDEAGSPPGGSLSAAKRAPNNPFGQDEEQEGEPSAKKKDSKLDYTPKALRAAGLDPKAARAEKRKEIANNIPADKAAVFAYNMNWSMVDDELISKVVMQWVEKKVQELIGDADPTLIEFVCEQVKSNAQPSQIVSELEMILDDDAESFVMRLWRLLIYECEARQVGVSSLDGGDE